METARRTTIATLLLALAIVAFATATATLVNITEWKVSAQDSPVVKVASSDATTYTELVTVGKYTYGGTNRTTITVVGFKGDPTTYTSVLKICNTGSRDVDVTLKYEGVLSSYVQSRPFKYIKYIQLLYPGTSSSPQTLTIDSSTPIGASISLGTITSGLCSDDIGVKVLVTPDAPTNQVLITIEVDVESQLSTSQATPES